MVTKGYSYAYLDTLTRQQIHSEIKSLTQTVAVAHQRANAVSKAIYSLRAMLDAYVGTTALGNDETLIKEIVRTSTIRLTKLQSRYLEVSQKIELLQRYLEDTPDRP
jgi:hypothetical protein